MLDLTGFGFTKNEDKSLRQTAADANEKTGEHVDSILYAMTSMLGTPTPGERALFDAMFSSNDDPNIIDDDWELVPEKLQLPERCKLRWETPELMALDDTAATFM